jgi:hypothetical protein
MHDTLIICWSERLLRHACYDAAPTVARHLVSLRLRPWRQHKRQHR